MGSLSCDTADKKLLIADGAVKNSAMRPISSKNEYDCSFAYNNTHIPAIVLFEVNDHREFQDVLPALAETRSVVVAKIPAALAQGAHISLVIKHNLSTEVIPLKAPD